MKALTYHGSKDVRVDSVPDPTIVADDDIILRVTSTAICGSDLHIYRGKIPKMEHGDILGHEFMGIVEAAGPAVTRVKLGDRVVVPFTISCGDCYFCQHDLFAACENTNPDRGAIINKKQTRAGAGLFGYSHLYGGYPGGQAEFVRVPKANVGPLVIPDSTLSDDQVLFLSDILPTGYQAAVNGNVGKGSTVAIFGAGPVGLMAAASARFLGAERIFMVDHHPYRLEFAAQTYGVEPINFDEKDDAAEIIIERTDGRGVDASIDAVGFEAKGSTIETALTAVKLEGSSGKALRQEMAATRRGGVVSVPGVYAGFIHGFLFGDAFEKGLTIKGGQTHAQHFMPELLDAISDGRLKPEVIITHHLPLDEAARGYQIFNDKEEDCRKVVLTPDSSTNQQGVAMDSTTRQFAVVTGASTGIGLQLAHQCAQHGFDLLIAADESEIEDAAMRLREHGGQVDAIEADLATIDGVEQLYEAIGGRPVDALLANAGRGLGAGFLDQEWEAAQHVIDTNITGTVYLIQKVGRDMRSRGSGRILITGSIAGLMPGSFQAVYNGSKAFLDSFSYALRNELKDSGVSVSVLMPGATDTDFFERADMLDTKVGTDKKDDPADVAKVGFEAMMNGEADVVAGFKNKVQATMANVMPATLLAEQHRKMAEPGSATR